MKEKSNMLLIGDVNISTMMTMKFVEERSNVNNM